MDSDDELIELEPPDGYEYELDPVGRTVWTKTNKSEILAICQPYFRHSSGLKSTPKNPH